MSFLRKHWLGISLGVVAVAAAVALVVVFPPAALVPVLATVATTVTSLPAVLAPVLATAAAILTTPPAIVAYLALGVVATVNVVNAAASFFGGLVHRVFGKKEGPANSTDRPTRVDDIYSTDTSHIAGIDTNQKPRAMIMYGENTAPLTTFSTTEPASVSELEVNVGNDQNVVYSPASLVPQMAEVAAKPMSTPAIVGKKDKLTQGDSIYATKIDYTKYATKNIRDNLYEPSSELPQLPDLDIPDRDTTRVPRALFGEATVHLASFFTTKPADVYKREVVDVEKDDSHDYDDENWDTVSSDHVPK
jgi:hypothetical protein